MMPGMPMHAYEEPPTVKVQRREACAACLIIACSLDDADVSLQAAARDVFNRHGGEAVAMNTSQSSGGMFGRAAMGPQIMYSGKHDGVCLYITRLLYDIWREPLIRDKTSPVDRPFRSRLTYDALLGRSRQLTLVSAFLEETGCATAALAGPSVREQWEQQTVRRMMEVAKPRTAVQAARRAAGITPMLFFGSDGRAQPQCHSCQETSTRDPRHILNGRTFSKSDRCTLKLWKRNPSIHSMVSCSKSSRASTSGLFCAIPTSRLSLVTSLVTCDSACEP